MERNRLEAFSDGVLAIIITIMVLELGLPAGDGVEDLLALGPTLVAYLLSFLFVAIYWVNHHLILLKADSINVKILWCNIAWLFIMSFSPFGTAWVGSYPTSWAPVTFYFAGMLLAAIAFHVMRWLIARENGEEFKLGFRNTVTLAVYFAAAALGWLCPVVGFIVVAIVSCWWIVPEKGSRLSEPHSDAPEEEVV